MQKPNAEKRRTIMASAARLFASRPFHEVRLDDVAAHARVGKGTVYIYFKSKEALYLALIHDGFGALLEQLRRETTAGQSPAAALERIVRSLVTFAFDHPQFYQLLRAGGREEERRGLLSLRAELTGLIGDTLRRGVRQRLWADPHPQLTATFIPGLVRSAILFGPARLSEKVLTSQILRLLRGGLTPMEAS